MFFPNCPYETTFSARCLTLGLSAHRSLLIPEDLGVVFCLLEAVAGVLVDGLCFNDGDCEIRPVVNPAYLSTFRCFMAILTEADTCRKYVLPKLYGAGWDDDQIAEQKTFTDGRIIVGGSKPPARQAEAGGLPPAVPLGPRG